MNGVLCAALLAAALAAAATTDVTYAKLRGKSKIDLARSRHGGGYPRKGGPKVRAGCRRIALSADGARIAAQNRSILMLVQTMTASKSNLCEGSRADWRDGLAQCLHQLTGLAVIAHNDDGTCADCGTLRRTPCSDAQSPGRPPAFIVVLGGGEDKRLKFKCANNYCGRTGEPFVVDAGNNAPHDYLGACDVFAFNRQGKRILDGDVVDPTAVPPTKIAWLPILNPHAEIRGLYERSFLYAAPGLLGDVAIPNVTRPPSAPRTPDFEYQRRTIEPAFRAAGVHTPIEIIRDDALPKPVLLPPKEQALRDFVVARSHLPRERTLIYIGSYRPTKGQLAFLKKLDPRALGPFTLEFYGLRQPDLGDDWDAIVAEAESPRLRGKVRLRDSRVSHETMMTAMTTASGLVHYSSGDRNPRVIYEALMFGLPVFVSIQAMPYIGLQCSPFATLTDTNASSTQLNADLRHFVKYLADSEAFKAKMAASNYTLTEVSLGGGERHWTRKVHNAQIAVATFVDEELSEHAVYANFCERFGICARRDVVRDPRTPWARRGNCRRALRRFENWHTDPWGPSIPVKRKMAISSRKKCTMYDESPLPGGYNCKQVCYARNRAEYAKIAPRQWWQSKYQTDEDGDKPRNAKFANRQKRLQRQRDAAAAHGRQQQAK